MSLSRRRTLQPPPVESELMLEINTTPLIDVMLVLLIMLIITVPAQRHATELQLPAPASTTPRPPDPEAVNLRVDALDHLWWNQDSLQDRADLLQHLKHAATQNPQPVIHLHAAPESSYAQVAMILSLAQNQGVQRLGIELEPGF